MTKVKAIGDDELHKFEEAINDFIKDKKVIDIKFDVYHGTFSNYKYALIIYEGG